MYKRTSEKLRQQACSTIGKIDENVVGETSNSVKIERNLCNTQIKNELKLGEGQLTYDQIKKFKEDNSK